MKDEPSRQARTNGWATRQEIIITVDGSDGQRSFMRDLPRLAFGIFHTEKPILVYRTDPADPTRKTDVELGPGWYFENYNNGGYDVEGPFMTDTQARREILYAARHILMTMVGTVDSLLAHAG